MYLHTAVAYDPPHILPRQSVQYSRGVEGVPHLIMYLHTAVAYDPPPISYPASLSSIAEVLRESPISLCISTRL